MGDGIRCVFPTQGYLIGRRASYEPWSVALVGRCQGSEDACGRPQLTDSSGRRDQVKVNCVAFVLHFGSSLRSSLNDRWWPMRRHDLRRWGPRSIRWWPTRRELGPPLRLLPSARTRAATGAHRAGADRGAPRSECFTWNDGISTRRSAPRSMTGGPVAYRVSGDTGIPEVCFTWNEGISTRHSAPRSMTGHGGSGSHPVLSG